MDTEDFGPIALHRQESVLTYNNRTEVLVVGSGIMGSVVARLLREGDPSRAITMIDGGKPIGEALGVHVHDVDDPVLWSRYNERAVSGIQTMYMGIATVPEVAAASLGELATGMHNAAALGKDAAAMPGAALAWNAGGMGVRDTVARRRRRIRLRRSGRLGRGPGDREPCARRRGTPVRTHRGRPGGAGRAAAALRGCRVAEPRTAADAHGHRPDGVGPHAAHRARNDLPGDRSP